MIKPEKNTNKPLRISACYLRTSAFTLIELLISIGILAILAGIGFINIVNYKQRQDLSFAGQEIIEVLRNAQNRSLSQEATSTAGTGGRWGVYFENPQRPPVPAVEVASCRHGWPLGSLF